MLDNTRGGVPISIERVGDVVQINSKCLEITAIDRKECLKSGQIKVRLTGDYAEGPKQGKECREVYKSATRTLVLYTLFPCVFIHSFIHSLINRLIQTDNTNTLR